MFMILPTPFFARGALIRMFWGETAPVHLYAGGGTPRTNGIPLLKKPVNGDISKRPGIVKAKQHGISRGGLPKPPFDPPAVFPNSSWADRKKSDVFARNYLTSRTTSVMQPNKQFGPRL
jgi:hypothetical protein